MVCSCKFVVLYKLFFYIQILNYHLNYYLNEFYLRTRHLNRNVENHFVIGWNVFQIYHLVYIGKCDLV